MEKTFDAPYAIIPDVAPSKTGAAPGSTKNPPVFKCFAAIWDEIAEVHTDCFSAKSTFATKLSAEALPPHHPPATLITAIKNILHFRKSERKS